MAKIIQPWYDLIRFSQCCDGVVTVCSLSPGAVDLGRLMQECCWRAPAARDRALHIKERLQRRWRRSAAPDTRCSRLGSNPSGGDVRACPPSSWPLLPVVRCCGGMRGAGSVTSRVMIWHQQKRWCDATTGVSHVPCAFPPVRCSHSPADGQRYRRTGEPN